ncbi:hypothetical protein H6P81_010868 [Aristolochia fimbriata]|uniref:EF-hand domain-containing protein n=1 Tax=Aristolochia fimbriata TaxID=158543 RepID=A0AAV7EUE9_ARIFI|nr:hypothetical protein H6P81_010868 [Aristolochia fimbriata]
MAIMGCCTSPCQKGLPQREMSVREFKTWLMRFDMDRNGKISQDELKKAISTLHKWFAWWKAREGVKESDRNGNGEIDKDEIEQFVVYAQQHLNMKIQFT